MSDVKSAAGIGHNKPALDVPSNELLIREAKDAVAQAINSKNIDGSAVQLLAHAIMCAHYAEVHGAGKIAPLTVIFDSSKAASDIRQFMTDRLELTTPNDANASDDAKAERKDMATAQRQLLARSLTFAAHLSAAGLDFTKFDRKLACFQVPRNLLLLDGESAAGSLKSLPIVPLNRRSYMVNFLADDGKEGTRTVQASVARFIQVRTPTKKRGTGGTQSETDKAKAMTKDFSDSLKHIVAIIQDTSEDKFNAEDFSDEDVNNLSQLSRLLHRIHKARAATGAKPAPAKAKAKQAKAA